MQQSVETTPLNKNFKGKTYRRTSVLELKIHDKRHLRFATKRQPRTGLSHVFHIMAVCLRVEGNRVRCYCSNHQGQDIARRTLEKIINLTPKRDAYTWPQSPCHCVWVVYTMFLGVGFPIQRANLYSYLKSREKRGPRQVFHHIQKRVLKGWVCCCHYR